MVSFIILLLLSLVFGGIGAIYAKSKGQNLLGWFIGASSIGFILMLLAIVVGRIWVISAVYDWTFSFLTTNLGVDMVYCKLLAAFFAVLSLFAAGPLLAFILFRHQAGMAVWIAIGIFAAIALVIFIGYERTLFRADNGQALKYYIVTTAGYELSTEPGYNQKWGLKYQPVTSEVAKKINYWKEHGSFSQSPEIENPQRFFDALSGEPIVWYVERNARLYFYSMPGYDPQNGRMLRPVSSDIVERFERLKQRERAKQQAEQDRQQAQLRAEQRRQQQAVEERLHREKEQANAEREAAQQREAEAAMQREADAEKERQTNQQPMTAGGSNQFSFPINTYMLPTSSLVLDRVYQNATGKSVAISNYYLRGSTLFIVTAELLPANINLRCEYHFNQRQQAYLPAFPQQLWRPAPQRFRNPPRPIRHREGFSRKNN